MKHFCLALLLLASGAALAQDSDEAALALADRTSSQPTERRTCIEYAEAAVIGATYSDGSPTRTGGRASLAIRCDGAFAAGWRGVFSDRFDQFAGRGSAAVAVNTLKEAYVSFQSDGSLLLDVGRINVRQGAGFAYNPTDYFRADTVRALISIDPETVRDERMGTVMARFQTLWSSGSLTGLFAPHLESGLSSSTFSPDLGATNDASRWLLILSQRLTSELQPQISVTGAQHESPRLGLNVTYLLNHATVAYLEWSGSRGSSNLSRSGYDPAVPEDPSFHNQLSAGMTYTTATKLSVTVEYEYDGAAPDRREWAAVRSRPTLPYVRYRQYARTHGELAARQNLFAYAHWDDVGIGNLGLTALTRFDPFDHSRVTWMEARYHWQHAGVGFQWQRNAGDASSDLAPWPGRQSWIALVDYYF